MLDRQSYNTEIASYYRRSAWLYKYFWYSRKSLGLHYGFWYEDTRTHDESIMNQYKYIINAGKISRKMNILDAGCGVGGAAFYIASHTHASVTGITISNYQVNEANKLIASSLNTLKIKFLLADYTDTHLPSESFDCIYGIESICYASPKKAFLDEAYRLLKPGGSLIITDGYCRRKPINNREQDILANFCRGWRLKEIIDIKIMVKEIKKSHFNVQKVEDTTPLVLRSLERMKTLVRLALPFTLIAQIVPLSILAIISDNALSMKMSIKAVQSGLGGYYGIVARK